MARCVKRFNASLACLVTRHLRQYMAVAEEIKKLYYSDKKKKIPGPQGKEQEDLLRTGTAPKTVSARKGARK